MKKSLLKEARVRAFVLDRRTGKPLASVPVVVAIETNAGKLTPVSVLATDHAGYVSFDLKHLNTASKANKNLYAYRVGDESNRVDLGSVDQLDPGSGMVPILTDPLPTDPHMPRPQLPSIQSPDPHDCFVSPNSFFTNPSAQLGEGGCEIL